MSAQNKQRMLAPFLPGLGTGVSSAFARDRDLGSSHLHQHRNLFSHTAIANMSLKRKLPELSGEPEFAIPAACEASKTQKSPVHEPVKKRNPLDQYESQTPRPKISSTATASHSPPVDILGIVATQGAYLLPGVRSPAFQKPHDAQFAAKLEAKLDGLVTALICRRIRYRATADESRVGHIPLEVIKLRKAESEALDALWGSTSDDDSDSDSDSDSDNLKGNTGHGFNMDAFFEQLERAPHSARSRQDLLAICRRSEDTPHSWQKISD